MYVLKNTINKITIESYIIQNRIDYINTIFVMHQNYLYQKAICE